MPYSDLSDAWNSYDPRYRRVTDDDQYTETIPAVDTGQIQGPTRPGYNDPAVLARVYNDIQRDLKLSPDQALGFLSNLSAESLGFTLPQEVGPQIKGANTGGLGWSQWTANRRADFEDYLKRTGTTPTSYEGNYGFLTSELQKPEWQPFLDNLRKQKGAESATRYTERDYERPSRITGRQDWLGRTRRDLPLSQRALANEGMPQEAPVGQGAAQLPPNQLVGPGNYLKRIGMNEDQDEADRRFDERMKYLDKRTNAYGDWTKQATVGEIEDAGPFGAPRFYTPPMSIPDFPRDMGYGYGYSEGENMPLPSSRQPGLNALRQEGYGAYLSKEPQRDDQLRDALQRGREGIPYEGMLGDILQKSSRGFIPGTPISDVQVNELESMPFIRGANRKNYLSPDVVLPSNPMGLLGLR